MCTQLKLFAANRFLMVGLLDPSKKLTPSALAILSYVNA